MLGGATSATASRLRSFCRKALYVSRNQAAVYELFYESLRLSNVAPVLLISNAHSPFPFCFLVLFFFKSENESTLFTEMPLTLKAYNFQTIAPFQVVLALKSSYRRLLRANKRYNMFFPCLLYCSYYVLWACLVY